MVTALILLSALLHASWNAFVKNDSDRTLSMAWIMGPSGDASCVGTGPIVGAPGTVAGVTLFDANDDAPFPTAFVARTVHVTATPFVRPVTEVGEAGSELLLPPQVAA